MPLPTHNSPQVLVFRPRQKEITHSPRQHCFENWFPLTAGRGGGNYNLLCQNSVRKYEDGMDREVFYILYDLQFFQM